MGYSSILCEKSEHVAVVTLNRPEVLNAFTPEIFEELPKVLDALEADDDVRVGIITGAGRAFSAGAYLRSEKTHMVETLGAQIRQASKGGTGNLFDKVYSFPKPLIAAINGHAVGGGFQVAMNCDILVAAQGAEMGMVQITLGLIPTWGGGLRLARYVGKGKAMEMVLTGKRITADEAYRVGLVNKVVPLDQLMPTAMEYATHLASLPPLAVRLAKESLLRSLDIPDMRDAAQADLYRFSLLMLTEDNKEAHRAWREKRKPAFKGE